MNRILLAIAVVLWSCSSDSKSGEEFDAGAEHDMSPAEDAPSVTDLGECESLLAEYTGLVASFRSCDSDEDCMAGFGCSGEPVGIAIDADRLRAEQVVADAAHCDWAADPPGSCRGVDEANASSPVGTVEAYAGICVANECGVEPRVDCEDAALYANGRYPVALLDTQRDAGTECSSDNDCVVRADTNPCDCNDAAPGDLGDFDDEIASVVDRLRDCGVDGLCSCPGTDDPICTDAGKCELASRWPNEPPGASVLADQPFNVVELGELRGGVDAPDGIVEDPSAPVSSPNVLQLTLPEGTPGGTEAGGVAIEAPLSEWYIGLAVGCLEWESSAQGDTLLRVRTAGDVDSVHVGFTTDSEGVVRLRVGIGDDASTPTWLDTGEAEFSCDSWHEVELIVGESTIRLWLDGTEIFADTAIDVVSAPAAFVLQPRWGEAGELKTETSTLRFDHLRVVGYEAF